MLWHHKTQSEDAWKQELIYNARQHLPSSFPTFSLMSNMAIFQLLAAKCLVRAMPIPDYMRSAHTASSFLVCKTMKGASPMIQLRWPRGLPTERLLYC